MCFGIFNNTEELYNATIYISVYLFDYHVIKRILPVRNDSGNCIRW